MFNWLHKRLPKNTFYALLEMILHLEKKHAIPTPLCLTLLFQKKIWLIKGGLLGRNEGCNKKRVSGIYKKFHLIILEGVLISGSRVNGLPFFLRIGISSTLCNQVKQSNIKKCGLHLWRTVYLGAQLSLFRGGCVSQNLGQVC